MRLAILEDDVTQAAFERDILSAAGHSCHTYLEGHALIRDLRRQAFDLLVLDWNVPDMTGDAVLRWIRHNLPAYLPVLFVTCNPQWRDIEAMLNAGADDYVVKPVSAGVLKARVGALLRRAYHPVPATGKAAVGDFEFDLNAQQVRCKGYPVALTRREFELALLLFQHLGQLVTRAQVLARLRPEADDLPASMMDTHISLVRLKLGLRPENGYRVRFAHGYGYRLEQVTADSSCG